MPDRLRAGKTRLQCLFGFRQPSDDAEWLGMRHAHDSEAAHQIDMAVWLARADAAVLVAQRADRQGLAGLTAAVCTPTDVIQARRRTWKAGMLIGMCGGTASGPHWCARRDVGAGARAPGARFRRAP